MSTAAPPLKPKRKRHRLRRVINIFVGIVLVYVAVAYLVMPWDWRRYLYRHPALAGAPRITHTGEGIPGDPLNVALIGTEDEVKSIMLAAKWYPADMLTWKSCLRIAGDTLLRRSYDDAPVSNLYLWGRKEDLAFEQPVGHDPRQRNHVRFWRTMAVDAEGRPLWIGSATYDTSVGVSHTTGQITHHIAPDIDAERDRLFADLRQTGRLEAFSWVDDFQDQHDGRNGGGDPYHTDGRLAVGLIAPDRT
jgi:hypothetical protein